MFKYYQMHSKTMIANRTTMLANRTVCFAADAIWLWFHMTEAGSPSSTDGFVQLWKSLLKPHFVRQRDNTEAESKGDGAGEQISIFIRGTKGLC